jgi:glucose-6-phosphate-specific signal transduction histidine kinase
MEVCFKEEAKNVIKLYINALNKQIKKILKNFRDMDLENADIEKQMQEIMNNIELECKNLITELQTYPSRFL